MAKKKAVITGITGQDGSYLAELLVKKGYEVHGIVRRSSKYFIGSDGGQYEGSETHLTSFDESKVNLHYGDLSDYSSIDRLIRDVRPDEVYNLAAMSDVRVSFDIPEYTSDITGVGALRVIESVRNNKLSKTSRLHAAAVPPDMI